MFGFGKRLNQQFTTGGSVMFETPEQERARLLGELKKAEQELNSALNEHGLELRRPGTAEKNAKPPRVLRDVLAFGAGYAVRGLMK